MTKIVCISDTHGRHERIKIPYGDLLIHAGDFTDTGTMWEIEEFNRFLGKLPHQYKIVVAGNHDFTLETNPEKARAALTNCIYLQDSEVTIESLRIYGSPWQPAYSDLPSAFTLVRGRQMKEKWDLIPQGIDLLVTHAPPYGICDGPPSGEWHGGCDELRKAVARVKPKFHIFGHVHAGYGRADADGISFINAALYGRDGDMTFGPVVIDMPELT